MITRQNGPATSNMPWEIGLVAGGAHDELSSSRDYRACAPAASFSTDSSSPAGAANGCRTQPPRSGCGARIAATNCPIAAQVASSTGRASPRWRPSARPRRRLPSWAGPSSPRRAGGHGSRHQSRLGPRTAVWPLQRYPHVPSCFPRAEARSPKLASRPRLPGHGVRARRANSPRA